MRQLVSKLLNFLNRKPALLTLAGNGLSAGLGLLTIGLLARWMLPAEFGRWVVFQTVLGFFDTFRTGFLLNGLISHAASARPDAFRRWAGAVWQLSLTVTGVVGTGFVGAAYGADALGWPDFVTPAWWLLLNVAVGLPGAVAGWLLHTQARFGTLQLLRPVVQLLFVGGIGYGYLTDALTAVNLYQTFALANGMLSILTMLVGWCQLRTLTTPARAERKQLIGFGRFAMPTLLVSNLLRSSDTLLLGALLGPASVARYAVPQRLVELFEMPVRSVVVTTMPRLAQLTGPGRVAEWAGVFNRGAGGLWLLLLPATVICFIFAEPLVVVLGGPDRADSAVLLRCFMLYAALLPLERYSGVGLDVLGKPGLNLKKVTLMLVVNMLGDLVAIYVFQSPVGVALVSTVTFGTGLVLGYRWLGRLVPVSLGSVFQAAGAEVRRLTTLIRPVVNSTPD